MVTDKLFNRGDREQRIVRSENIVGPVGGVHLNFLSPDIAVDGQLLSRTRCSDTRESSDIIENEVTFVAGHLIGYTSHIKIATSPRMLQNRRCIRRRSEKCVPQCG